MTINLSGIGGIILAIACAIWLLKLDAGFAVQAQRPAFVPAPQYLPPVSKVPSSPSTSLNAHGTQADVEKLTKMLGPITRY